MNSKDFNDQVISRPALGHRSSIRRPRRDIYSTGHCLPGQTANYTRASLDHTHAKLIHQFMVPGMTSIFWVVAIVRNTLSLPGQQMATTLCESTSQLIHMEFRLLGCESSLFKLNSWKCYLHNNFALSMHWQILDKKQRKIVEIISHPLSFGGKNTWWIGDWRTRMAFQMLLSWLETLTLLIMFPEVLWLYATNVGEKSKIWVKTWCPSVPRKQVFMDTTRCSLAPQVVGPEWCNPSRPGRAEMTMTQGDFKRCWGSVLWSTDSIFR